MTVRLSSLALLLGAAALALPFAAAAFAPERGLRDAPVSVTTITAGEIRGPSPLETAILGEINTLRRDPGGYVVNLRGLGGRNNVAAVNAAIDALERAPPVSALTFNPSLSSVAIGHANYLGPLGLLTHTGYGGSTLGVRFRDQGWITTLPAEELVVGRPVARELVINLVIDAGVPGAPHRSDLLNPVFTFAGIGCAPHTQYPAVCVINLSNAPMAHQEWEEAMLSDDLGTRPLWRRNPGPPVRTPPREYGPDDSLMDAPWPGSVYDGAGSGVSDGLSYSDDLPFGFNPQGLSEAPQAPGETCPPSSLDYLGGVSGLDIGDLDGSMFIDGWGASSSYDDLSGFGAHDDFTTDAFTEACPEVRLRGADGPYTPP